MGGFYLFSLYGVPVFISGWYFALIAYYAYVSGAAQGLLFGLCVTVSLLVHEFGHALVAKYYRLSPAVLLHGFGGLCGHERPKRDRDESLIVAAGPGAGLLFGGLVWVVREVLRAYYPEVLAGNVPLLLTFTFFLYINILWSLLNLLPLWPLDGGQLCRLLLQQFCKPATAARATHGVSIVVGMVALALVLMFAPSPFMVIIVGYLLFQNFTGFGQIAAPRSEGRLVKDMLNEAEEALSTGDTAKAARLCHQVRAENVVSEASMNKAWAILSVTSYAHGDAEEADSYAERAPDELVLEMLARLPKAG